MTKPPSIGCIPIGTNTLKIGDKYPTWFSGNADGLSIILGIFPYAGQYKDWFTRVIRLSAPSTMRGWMDQTVRYQHLQTPLQ
jgi:hypothetical protein